MKLAGYRLAFSVLALSLPAATQNPQLEPVRTSITITERISAEAPAEVERLERGEIEKTPGINLDDRLRDLPGFSLFRRSSSLVAHPTTQGVSLRGIGPSGASRTLVLWDGIPISDPFGGWVYWTRIAPEELEAIELVRSASTSAFGDRAMGGVIALTSREAERGRIGAAYEGGGRGTHQLSAGVSHLWSRWAVSGHARAFTTDGYFIVPERSRGAVDRRAALDFVAGAARLDWFGARDRAFLKFDALAEDRANGTALQNNSTGLGAVAAHWSHERQRDGLAVLGWHTREEFRSAFTAIAADRNSERLTVLQSVPADATGGAAMWNRRGSRFNLLAGGDAVRIEGWSRERLFPTGRRTGGGILTQHGAFAQTNLAAGPVRLFLGARHHFTGQDRSFFSPSAGLTAGRGLLRGRASVYRSFRAPTLNELYREFRVGNAVTRANPELRPERLWGAETGFDIAGESRRVSFSAFRNSLADLVTNVTLRTAPNLIERQRRNAAAALARGFELDASGRWSAVTAEAQYLFVDSRFRTGERIPQVARHQGSVRLGYTRGATAVWAGLRSYSSQFEDERNTRDFLLPGFATVQLYARRQLTTVLAAIFAMENLLDREYLAGRSPAPLTGAPRLWRAGLRWERRAK